MVVTFPLAALVVCLVVGFTSSTLPDNGKNETLHSVEDNILCVSHPSRLFSNKNNRL
jgi:hypothetical protein